MHIIIRTTYVWLENEVDTNRLCTYQILKHQTYILSKLVAAVEKILKDVAPAE